MVRDRTLYLHMVLARVSDFSFTTAECLRFIAHGFEATIYQVIERLITVKRLGFRLSPGSD